MLRTISAVFLFSSLLASSTNAQILDNLLGNFPRVCGSIRGSVPPCRTILRYINFYPMCNNQGNTVCMPVPAGGLALGWECGACGVALETTFNVEYKFEEKSDGAVPFTYGPDLERTTDDFLSTYATAEEYGGSISGEIMAEGTDAELPDNKDKIKVAWKMTATLRNETAVDIGEEENKLAEYVTGIMGGSQEQAYIDLLKADIPEFFDIAENPCDEVKA